MPCMIDPLRNCFSFYWCSAKFGYQTIGHSTFFFFVGGGSTKCIWAADAAAELAGWRSDWYCLCL